MAKQIATAVRAVGIIRAAMLKERLPAEPSKASIEALEETALSLEELREDNKEPDLKRDPRPEHGAARPAGPTRASDTAHLMWQMRRALLCQRWKVWPLMGSVAASEEEFCNVVSGAALAQGTVDAPLPFGESHKFTSDEEWQVDLLQGLTPAGVKPPADVLRKQRIHLARLLAFARGSYLTVVRNVGPASVLSKADLENGWKPSPYVKALKVEGVWWPSLQYANDLVANYDTLLIPVEEIIGVKGLKEFMAELPASLHEKQPGTPKSLAECRFGRPMPCRDVYKKKQIPRIFDHVYVIATSIRIADGNFVLLLHDLQGAPIYMSNGAKPSVKRAFEHCLKESHSWRTRSWIGDFKEGAILCGDGVLETDVPIAVRTKDISPAAAEWKRKIVGASNAIRAALHRGGAQTVLTGGNVGSTGLSNLRRLVLVMSVALQRKSGRIGNR